MENIFYDNRELGIFLSNKELEELKTSGNISNNKKGRNLEVKIFENEKNGDPIRLNSPGKEVGEIDNIELYVDKSIPEELEENGFVRSQYGINEVVFYSESYDFIDTLDGHYNLKR